MLEEKSARIIGSALAAIIFISLSGSAYASVGGALAAGEDGFGLTKVYPTKEGGREWFVDMDDPRGRDI
jgi:hypothetical protein